MLSKTHAKYIQSFHHKKNRDQAGVFIAEGTRLVTDLLQTSVLTCLELWALPAFFEKMDPAIRAAIPVTGEVNELQLKQLSMQQQPQEVLAIFKQKPGTEFDASNQISLLLDEIQDPGNLGTIIRLADWFGIQNIICTPGTADCYNPKVVQSTMGSLARVNIYYCADPEEWLQRQEATPRLSAMLEGTPLQELTGIKAAILMIGNEGRGLSKNLADLSHQKITIPRRGGAESLNAAVATGIILSQLCR